MMYKICDKNMIIDINVKQDIDLDYLNITLKNKLYYNYINILSNDFNYRYIIIAMITNVINKDIDKDLFNLVLKNIYSCNDYNELLKHCKKTGSDVNKITQIINTYAKNIEIQKVYDDFINRLEEILAKNITYILFGDKIEEEI